ncbi:MAG TPA: 16S rRNA (cytosine(1402)-N(4))-methyltransferase RsmH [Firmicutes bacterium]|uniref:Ribosomal RNA small subunit methyltransferase H n=1 Tax=candidate division TA06 bacterium TaxID=2250710 RepID=A0A660SCK3_UNCT6|nr:MAG: 16S rRNA (cytosine(1402)-N(4))-methyltransferase [candidate division TA06 bacterium]HFD04759.1 16S rRNA (cytosine(1402)-N(4))-methyltransferase RsmH [Bacillota bacterium]
MLEHVPVLLDESAEFICSNLVEGTIIDCTCGAGGHSRAFLERTENNVKLICIDRDKDAIEIAKENLSEYGNRVEFMNIRFSEIDGIFRERMINRVFFDLGISTMQIDAFEKGFTYKKDQKLDMGMGKNDITAYKIVNEYSFEKLVEIFKTFGQERFSTRIADRIVNERNIKPIETTGELALIIRKTVPRNLQLKTLSRIFQSLRIAVNEELSELEKALAISIDNLDRDGRIGVITYHSLERNIVRRLTVTRDDVKVKKKNPGRDEIKNNRRARSAKLYKIVKL